MGLGELGALGHPPTCRGGVAAGESLSPPSDLLLGDMHPAGFHTSH